MSKQDSKMIRLSSKGSLTLGSKKKENYNAEVRANKSETGMHLANFMSWKQRPVKLKNNSTCPERNKKT